MHRNAFRSERREGRFNDRQFLKSEFRSPVDTLSLYGSVDVDLFTCGKDEVLGNSMCPIYHNKQDDTFK